MAQSYEISSVKLKFRWGYADCLIWIFKCSVAFWWLLYHCFPYICNDAHLQPSPISYTANTTAINKMSFAGDRVLEVKWGRNISCDQLVRIFSTGLLKGVVEMWIFHSPSLLLAKECFRVSGSVSERLSKRKKSGDVISCCSSVNVVIGNQKAAMLLVTIPGRAVSPSSVPWLLS